MTKARIFITGGIILGIVLLILSFFYKKDDKGFIETTGYFMETGEYYSGNISSSTALVYKYYVDGNEYKIKTDYGTSIIPEVGSKVTIRYNKDNPQDATIKGNGKHVFIFITGMMFICVSLVLLIASFGVNIVKYAVVFALIIMGSLFYYILVAGTGSFLPIAAFKSIGFVIIIPIIFIFLGTYELIHSLVQDIKTGRINP